MLGTYTILRGKLLTVLYAIVQHVVESFSLLCLLGTEYVNISLHAMAEIPAVADPIIPVHVPTWRVRGT